MNQSEKHPSPSFSESLKTIPDIVGIRLNEQPNYTVLASSGDIEIRHYEKTLLAQVTETGSREEALKNGFQRLADYIFGKNTKNLHDEEPHGIKMAMTAPVFHEPKDEKWLISFVIPEKYNLSTVPRPQDSNIEIIKKKS